ncbi:MAG: hypothetical protein ACI9J3_000688, partial [Parvicellaceae bacterium]
KNNLIPIIIPRKKTRPIKAANIVSPNVIRIDIIWKEKLKSLYLLYLG